MSNAEPYIEQIAQFKKILPSVFARYTTRSTLLKSSASPPVTYECRDDEMQHMHRVGILSALLALEIGRPRREIAILRAAAPLHDIGKRVIPNQILEKPGELTCAEFNAMKAHTWIGWQILSSSPIAVYQFASHIALSHHEHWDGNGYPEGLAGDAIPLPARITAIADVFDALTHARPYKRAWNHQKAMEFIEQESRRHFDPALVPAFLSVVNNHFQVERLDCEF